MDLDETASTSQNSPPVPGDKDTRLGQCGTHVIRRGVALTPGPHRRPPIGEAARDLSLHRSNLTACACNGASSVVTVPDTTAAEIHGNQSLTIALWIKPEAPVRSGETLVARWGLGFREDDQYMLHLSDGGHVVFVVSDGSHEEWVMR